VPFANRSGKGQRAKQAKRRFGINVAPGYERKAIR
jgi:hypothetical protein